MIGVALPPFNRPTRRGRKMNTRRLFAALTLWVVAPSLAQATPTDVVIRVISQDAKFVGDSMGGAEVVLRDARSGTVLAKGVTRGGTGDTALIMAATGRSPVRSSETAAAFRTVLDIAKPILVRVDIRGPLSFPATIQRASSERWLIPGQSAATGDGWVIELPGLAIRMAAATPNIFRRGQPSKLTVEVQLMCGCPITGGGMWDAADYEVTAELRQPAVDPQRFALVFT